MSFPPKIEKRFYTHRNHNIERDDEFHWLRADNWQDVLQDSSCLPTDIRQSLEDENAYSSFILEKSSDLRETVFSEMRARMIDEDRSASLRDGIYSWFWRYPSGCEYGILYRANDDALEQLILDCNSVSQNSTYFKLGCTSHSPSQDLLAWSADFKGSEFFTIKIYNIDCEQDLPDILTNTTDSISWSSCGCYIFYIALDTNHRPYRVMRHCLGSPQSDDTIIYENNKTGYFLSIDSSRSGRFIFINQHDHETSEIWVIDASFPLSPAYLCLPACIGVQYSIDDDMSRDRFIILTNENSATDFKLMTCSTDGSNHKDLILHHPGSLILDMVCYEHYLVWLVRENALEQIKILCFETGKVSQITFDEETYDLNLHSGFEYSVDSCRFSYSSMTRPQQIFDYDMKTHKRILCYEQIIPHGHEPSNYISKRFWADASDGSKIPISLLYHKDTALDGTAPLLLYGYGAYGITIPASFSANRLSLVDRGFIYAIAHIRGSMALGYDWFLAGRCRYKQNSFSDFIESAQSLIQAGFVQKGRITIHGGSAGGLLIGAVINQSPGLFCGAVAEVPFVDSLNTMLDATLPLTPPEWPEWGNPITSIEDYHTIASYAPYETIKPMSYPHVLATAGLTDPRVTYWEAAKWVARLRDRRIDDGLTLLHIEMDAGHGGHSGRFHRLRETSLIYSFILSLYEDNFHSLN